MEPFTARHLYAQLIAHIIGFSDSNDPPWRAMMTNLIYFRQCIHGAAFSFNGWDRVMGNTPERRHQFYGINHYLFCQIDQILQ